MFYLFCFISLSLLLVVFYLARQRAMVDWQHPGLNWMDGLNRLYCHRFHRIQDKMITLPQQGAAIVVANHISGLDPLLLLATSTRRLRFLIASEEYERFGFTWLYRLVGCIPVDRQGRPEIAFRSALRALADGEVVALFPQGRIQHPSETMTRLKTGAVRLAYLSGAPITPLHIRGVRGAGDVFLPLFLRGRVVIQQYPSIEATKEQRKAVLQRIADCISGAIPSH